jgi:hypothetical protein
MDCEHDAREYHGSGNRLCGAGGCLRAGVPNSTGLRRSASAGPASGHCRAISPNSRLVSSAAIPASSGSPGTTTQTGGPAPTESRRGPSRPSPAFGRSHPGRSGSLSRLDIGLLGLERPLGMGWWSLGRPAQANGRLGRRSLGATWRWLRVDWRRLALIPKRPPHASLSQPHDHCHSCGLITAITMAFGLRYCCTTAFTCSSVTAS